MFTINEKINIKNICTSLKIKSYLFYFYLKIYFLFLSKKKICIKAEYSNIGDILILSPIIRKIKDDNEYIILICDKSKKEIAKRIPLIDKIITHDLYQLLDKKYIFLFDKVLNPYYNLINKKFLIDDLAKSLNLEIHDKKIKYILYKKEEKFALGFKSSKKDYIIFSPDSKSYRDKKEWLNNYWQKLIDIQKLPVILIGTSKNKFKNCIDLRNNTTINEAAALIKYCRLFVGIVSGLVWFTNAFSKKAIIINGGFELPILTKHKNSYHFYSNIKCSPCLSKDNCRYNKKCMKMIKPEKVNNQIKKILNIS